MNGLFWLVPVASITGLAFAFLFFKQMMKEDEGTDLMKKIAQHVRTGAMAYLRQQYKVVTIVFIILSLLFVYLAYGLHTQNPWVPFAFLTGGFFSGLAGFFGMKTATYASARTANAAMNSLNHGLRVAFRSGAVMGLVVVGLALLDISLWYLVLNHFVDATGSEKMIVITTTMLTFGMGASTQALFARVGGGIYTKAADVGADLVGKVEQGIPEDDPRNPAVIADNVGDNVGDCAGMGADLFETYAVTLISGMILAASVIGTQQSIEYPLALGIVAVLASIIGSFFVRLGKKKNIMGALYKGMIATGVISCVGFYFITNYMLKDIKIFFAAVVGLVVTLLITLITEYYTSTEYEPVRRVAAASETGAGTNVIAGLAVGLQSTFAPVVVIVLAIISAYWFGASSSLGNGIYGIAVAAIAMLSTTGMVIAVDSYGPITDNAGGIAEMAGLPKEVREHTDALDAVGNTTKAVTKGYAIASAALAALVLFQAFTESVAKAGGNISFDISNYVVMVGLLIGGLLPFLFSSGLMESVGKAAQDIVQEVRRQFKTLKIMEGKDQPEYGKCVDIVTKAALKQMIFPGLLAVFSPIIVGFILGPKALGGLLAGVIVSGFLLALQMSTGGAAWDNAKKYIERGNFGGKGGNAHKAAVVGDTVGDPFKDTAGPALNALIKVINTVALIIAPLIATYFLLK
ncbi:MAG TPA: sodium-translocating pyrophosphatase [Marinilabiliales bacterium]|nr:sodium-translocating pyrophosphatase [Marinilabiliales bacterium]